MRKSFILIDLLLILCFFAGCLSKPNDSEKTGNLKLTIRAAETSVSKITKAVIANVQQLRIVLTKDKTSNEYLYSFTQGTSQYEVTGVYPGEWAVTISALDTSGDAIFSATLDVQIESGVTTTAEPTLTPTRGKIDIRFNATGIVGFSTYTETTLYVYTGNKSESDSYKLKMDGNYFSGIFELAEGTYQGKIAVPKVADSVYTSPYFTININAGKTTQYAMAPDGTVSLMAIIDSTPATPQNFQASYDSASATVTLTWSTVTDSDLAGYSIYRADTDGRYKKIGEVASGVLSYDDNVSAINLSKIGYVITSFDQGSNYSLWSEPVYINK